MIISYFITQRHNFSCKLVMYTYYIYIKRERERHMVFQLIEFCGSIIFHVYSLKHTNEPDKIIY